MVIAMKPDKIELCSASIVVNDAHSGGDSVRTEALSRLAELGIVQSNDGKYSSAVHKPPETAWGLSECHIKVVKYASIEMPQSFALREAGSRGESDVSSLQLSFEKRCSAAASTTLATKLPAM